jgi:hypothetical protein|tara:strand:+ start:2058 stop:2303 length:246 start_codon:yes stop_codon:yes gene_type:complete
MPEKKTISEYISSIQGHRSQENERYVNESTEGGAIYGAEGGLRYDLFEHDDPDEDLPCVCDLPEHSQSLIIEDIEYQEGDA